MLKVGDHVKIDKDTENNTYRVSGHDRTSCRFWLCITNPFYDGYNGDLIITHLGDRLYSVVLTDDRASIRGTIELTVL